MHIIIETEGKIPFWEGQSYGVIPPGEFLIFLFSSFRVFLVSSLCSREQRSPRVASPRLLALFLSSLPLLLLLLL